MKVDLCAGLNGAKAVENQGVRRCLIPSLLTCIAFACGYPTYEGGDGGEPFYGNRSPGDEGGSDAGEAGATDAEADTCVSDAGTPPDFTPDKSCVVAMNCGVVVHHADCCDNRVIVGVAKNKLTEAQSLEDTWGAALTKNCKSCAACTPGPTITEDFDAGRLPDAGVQIECVGVPGLCRTRRP